MTPDSLCEDCLCSMKDHQGPNGECAYCACRCFVEMGPKE